jgi:ribosomal-protein-alanine N-acetyltransferase
VTGVTRPRVVNTPSLRIEPCEDGSVVGDGFEVRGLDVGHAEAIATWRYPGRYSTYDVGEAPTESAGFWAVVHGNDLVGYCCFGEEARVPGVEEESDTLDVGYGMRPDIVGHGFGRAFVTCILRFGIDRFSPKRLRLLILGWNDRSRKVAEALGFERHGEVESQEGTFLVMVREMS